MFRHVVVDGRHPWFGVELEYAIISQCVSFLLKENLSILKFGKIKTVKLNIIKKNNGCLEHVKFLDSKNTIGSTYHKTEFLTWLCDLGLTYVTSWLEALFLFESFKYFCKSGQYWIC